MCDSARAVVGATRLQTYRRTRQSVTSAPVKSAVVCGAAPASAVAHNVRAHRMSQSDDFVLITKTFGRETSPGARLAAAGRRAGSRERKAGKTVDMTFRILGFRVAFVKPHSVDSFFQSREARPELVGNATHRLGRATPIEHRPYEATLAMQPALRSPPASGGV